MYIERDSMITSLRGNHLSNTTCLTQMFSKVSNDFANCGNP